MPVECKLTCKSTKSNAFLRFVSIRWYVINRGICLIFYVNFFFFFVKCISALWCVKIKIMHDGKTSATAQAKGKLCWVKNFCMHFRYQSNRFPLAFSLLNFNKVDFWYIEFVLVANRWTFPSLHLTLSKHKVLTDSAC